MRGQIVACKEFNGVMINAVVWEDSGSLIFVHTGDQFQSHSAGRPHLESVGFPIEDVFIHNAEAGGVELEPYVPKRCPVTAI